MSAADQPDAGAALRPSVTPRPKRLTRCAFCAAPVQAGGAHCMLCFRSIAPGWFTLGAKEPAASAPGLLPQFTLATVFLGITAVSIWLALSRHSLPYGLSLLIVLVPATLRTVWIMHTRSRQGKPLSTRDTFCAFVASIGAVFLAVVLSLTVVCVPVLGPLLALGLFTYCVWLTRPR